MLYTFRSPTSEGLAENSEYGPPATPNLAWAYQITAIPRVPTHATRRDLLANTSACLGP